MSFINTVIIVAISLAVGAVGGFVVVQLIGRRARIQTLTNSITERIRAVGKLTGLEVMSKEIVTQTKGLAWLPPLLLSQARLAMIFHFEKQYYIDLGRLEPGDVKRVGPNRFVIHLPSIEGHLNLLEVIPYDIQSGKFLGLLDVFRMDAEAQKKMMQQAQIEASKLYEENAQRYEREARRAIARQVHSLLELFDVEVEVQFGDEAFAGSGERGDQSDRYDETDRVTIEEPSPALPQGTGKSETTTAMNRCLSNSGSPLAPPSSVETADRSKFRFLRRRRDRSADQRTIVAG